MGSVEPFTRSNSTGWLRRCWMSRIRAATSKRGSTSFRIRISSPRPSSRLRKSRRPSIMLLALLPRHRSVGRDAAAAHAYHRRGGAASRLALSHPPPRGGEGGGGGGRTDRLYYLYDRETGAKYLSADSVKRGWRLWP